MGLAAGGRRIPAFIRIASECIRLVAVLIVVGFRPAPAGNQALLTGTYGGTLGAGGATAAERSGFGQNPAALRPGWFGAHADFHRPYGMDELRVAEAGVFADGSRFGAAFEWRETGVDGLYDEQGFQACQVLRLGRARNGFPGALDLGLVWDRWSTLWPGGSGEVVWSHGFGAAWRMLPRLKAGAFVSGLPLEFDGIARTERVLQWGLEGDSRDQGMVSTARATLQILRLDFRKTGDTPWRILASLSMSPHPAVEFTGGLANPPFQVSLGIRVAWQGVEWHQALRYHRYLGRTWLSGLAYSRPFKEPG